MATTIELRLALMCFEAVESIDVGHPKLQHLATQDGDGNPLRISSTVYDHSIPPLLSSSPMLRALATLAVTPHSNNSATFTVLLPELKTMTSASQLLHKHSFSDTTKTGPEVVLNLSIISANLKAKFLSLLHDNYSAYLQDKFGWVSWYLMGTFMRKDFCAWKLFAEIPDSSCYVVLNRDICYCNGIWDKGGRSQFRKMQLKMAVAQIKLLRNKRQAVVKQLRRDIALLPQFGQDATARIEVQHVFRKHKILAANEFNELFYELIVSRLSIITQQRKCPPNLKGGIASLIFAFSRCYEISELIAVRNIFEEKYGKDFVYAAVDVRPSCDVNHMLWGDRGHTQFVDSASATEAVAKFARDTMVAAQVAAYLDNTYCNQDVDIVSLKKIKEDSPLSLIVSLRSICEGRFQSLDQFLPHEYCISLANNIGSQVKLREENYSHLFSDVHKFDEISKFNNMISAIPTMVTQSDELKLKFDEGSTINKLWLVNLGGSESLAKTAVQGESLKEAQNINKPLSALGDIISTLSRIKALNRLGHVDKENAKAVSLFENVMDLSDVIEDDVKWVENLIRGIFTGNIFDLGYAQLAEVFSNKGMSFLVSCQNLVT